MSQPEVERELAELRARVRGASTSQDDLTPLQKAIANVNAQWHLSAALPPPTPGAPLTWRAVYLAKRGVRRVLVELLNTLVQQQNVFNRDVARALTELAAQEAKIELLEKRITELQDQVKTLT